MKKLTVICQKAKTKREKERLQKIKLDTMIRRDTVGSSPTARVLRENLKRIPTSKNIGGYHFYPLSDD